LNNYLTLPSNFLEYFKQNFKLVAFMKNIIRCSALILESVWLAGCINISTHPRARDQVIVKERVVVVPDAQEDSATIAEIDAASKLKFDSTRVGAMSAIAQRSDLTPAAQVHLVEAALRCLDFENSKVNILQTLIDNRAFCRAAKESILVQLDKLSFENNRKAIFEAINHRGSLAQ
jgi:hypothetical protein